MVPEPTQGRRTFLKTAGIGTLAFATSYRANPLLFAEQGVRRRWVNQLGLQTYTVRDKMSVDFEGTLAKIAEAGYKEVEFSGSLGDRTPQQVRAALDRTGLKAVSTHIAVTPGPDLDRQLDAYQAIGHQFTAVRTAPATPRNNAPVAGAAGPVSGTGAAREPTEPNAPDRWKRMAEALNEVGRAGKKYGIRALFHNHVNEFMPLEGAGETANDILLAETDPTLVVMELDLGWASIAGQDVVLMFKQHPRRYPLWHVKDTTGLASAKARPIGERQGAAQFVPVGLGEVDYKTIFAAAEIAGLQHYFVEQDNAIQGDSLEAIRTSAQNLTRILK